MLAGCEEEFKVVKGKKKSRLRQRLSNNSTSTLEKLREQDFAQTDKITLQRRLNEIQSEICTTDFYSDAKDLLENAIQTNGIKVDDVTKIVCFGLGSFSNCLTSLHQLAFILKIQNDFKIPLSEFHDPIFNKIEKIILKENQCKLIEKNYEGKYLISDTTIIYLPHCPKQLTNNLLWKNWNKTNLSNTILICNSFENLLNNQPKRLLQNDAEYILKISNYVQEYPINNNYQFKDIFNDTSIHVFCKKKLNDCDENLWLKKDNKSPEYCDIELITNNIEEKLNLNVN